MARISLAYSKWPDRCHYDYGVRILGEDSYGVWGACEVGEKVYKAGELAAVMDDTKLALVPHSSCWSALRYPPTEPDYEVYVDINTPPVWSERRVEMVDLDLDVTRKR